VTRSCTATEAATVTTDLTGTNAAIDATALHIPSSGTGSSVSLTTSSGYVDLIGTGSIPEPCTYTYLIGTYSYTFVSTSINPGLSIDGSTGEVSIVP
jgi:hypothetical protein